MMATSARGFLELWRRLDRTDCRGAHVREVEGSYTAQAFITTDLDDNQITAFHPGR